MFIKNFGNFASFNYIAEPEYIKKCFKESAKYSTSKTKERENVIQK